MVYMDWVWLDCRSPFKCMNMNFSSDSVVEIRLGFRGNKNSVGSFSNFEFEK
jgi:hypothetical protein